MRIRREGPSVVLLFALVIGSIAQLAVAGQAPAGQAPATQAPAQTPAAQAKPAETKPAPDQQDLIALSQLVDASSGQAPAADVRVTWRSNHFVKSQGDTVYIPFTVAIDRTQLTATSAAVYVRAINKAPATPATPPPAGARPSYAWDTIYFVDLPADGNLSRAIALPSGTYDVLVGVKEKGAAAGKMGLLKHELTVPALGTELTTSSVILTKSFEQMTAPLPADKQQDNPYVFGTVRLAPSLDHVFAKTSNLQLMFWIYGASETAGKPDVLVEFNFHVKQPDGTQKFFNKTQPQTINQTTLPAEFDLTKGHQLYSSLVIPLASFSAGDYRLEIKVTDKPSGKSVTRDVDFQVAAS